MELLCLFVNYNNTQYSISCVNSLLNGIAERVSLDIVIIDNNSSEKEKELLRDWGRPQFVNIYMLDENIGYFPALNRGLSEYGEKKEYQYIIIGNNDLIFDENFVPHLCSQRYNTDVFVIAPNIINADKCHQNPQVRKKYSRLQLIYLDLYHSSYYVAYLLLLFSKYLKFRSSTKNRAGHDKNQYILKGYGACYILTRRYLDVIRGIPDYLFLMNEESALTDVVLKNNGRIYYDKDLIVNHMEHTSVGKLSNKGLYKIAQDSYKKSKRYFSNGDLRDKYIQ
ncbi:glycosyltransferase [Bacteroides cellulosilyticus]|jgi:GT2 family glycosyltransferase|uniref:glycosyltransferase n=1 Tax=Bacteroides cellulosilyticus TaxID=246787 RepID=UPI0032BFEB1B